MVVAVVMLVDVDGLCDVRVGYGKCRAATGYKRHIVETSV